MSSKPDDAAINSLPVLVPTLQIGFFSRLIESQEEYLLPALLAAVSELEIARVDAELLAFAGEEKLHYLAKFGLRGELLFPIPYLLLNKPKLIAYYRLLFGFSQKEFYNSSAFGMFSSMETRGVLTDRVNLRLTDLCNSLIQSAWTLVNGIPAFSLEILNALTLLTLGGQLRGSYNTQLGQSATRQVFDTIRDLVSPSVVSESPASITIRNAAGRSVRIEFAPDPDIAIREQLSSGRFNNRIAIEIKGGKDISNIHNRLGEAEKSHQKARQQGFNQFWTMVNVKHLDLNVARRESPTTTAFFSISQIIDPRTMEYTVFKELLMAELGL